MIRFRRSILQEGDHFPMAEQMFDRVHEGQDVYDAADDKLGEIDEIYGADTPEGERAAPVAQ